MIIYALQFGLCRPNNAVVGRPGGGGERLGLIWRLSPRRDARSNGRGNYLGVMVMRAVSGLGGVFLGCFAVFMVLGTGQARGDCDLGCSRMASQGQEGVWGVAPALEPLRMLLYSSNFDINGSIRVDASQDPVVIEAERGTGVPDVSVDLPLSRAAIVRAGRRCVCRANKESILNYLGFGGRTVFSPNTDDLNDLLVAYYLLGGGTYRVTSEAPYMAEGTGNIGAASVILGLLRYELSLVGVVPGQKFLIAGDFVNVPALGPSGDLDGDGLTNRCEYARSWPAMCDAGPQASWTYEAVAQDPFGFQPICDPFDVDDRIVKMPPLFVVRADGLRSCADAIATEHSWNDRVFVVPLHCRRAV